MRAVGTRPQGAVPVERDVPDGDFSDPLQLLASVLEFVDPVDGMPRRFETRRRLSYWPEAQANDSQS